MVDVPGTSREAPRETLDSKAVIVFHYSHLDWAWRFTRRWHAARYVQIFDEALALAESDPTFCFFADSLAESLEPYFAIRPGAAAKWRDLLASGRFGLVGGHYANVRPSTAPEETYIRNIEEGRRLTQEWFPGFEPKGFSNLDTAIGHSQLPQVLSLSGIRYYLTGRPEMAFDLEKRPKIFRWQGPGETEIVTCVQHYGILVAALVKMADADPDVREEGRRLLKEQLAGHAEAPVDTIFAFFAMDDMRPLRHAVTDEYVDIPLAMSEWNDRGSSMMCLGTPDQFFDRLEPQMGALPAVCGPVDQSDVGYNGPFPQAALRPLRDQASARLVEAEVILAMAGVDTDDWPEETLRGAWRDTLRAQAHAVQFLFAEDVDAMRLNLFNAIHTGDELRKKGMDRLVGEVLPQDTDAAAIVSTIPHSRRQLVSIPIIRTDAEISGYQVLDEDGTPLLQQATAPKQPGRYGEWELLVDLELPAMGWRKLSLVKVASTEFPTVENLPLTGVVSTGALSLFWDEGHLVRVKGSAGELTANLDASILEPVVFLSERRGWMPTKITEQGERVQFSTLRCLENGPLRWRFERTGTLRGHHIVQDITVTNTGRIECETRINHGLDEGYFGLTVPCEEDARFSASIPFGVEERHVEDVTYCEDPEGYRIIERAIPGIFYARDWVSGKLENTPFGFVVLDGDRYWYRPPGQASLVHLLFHMTRPYSEGWEQYAEMDRAGFMSLRHALVLGAGEVSPSQLSDIADESRFPVRVVYSTVNKPDPPQETFLSITPGHIRMLACRRVGDELEIRLVESAGKACGLRIEFAASVKAAYLSDFQGDPLPDSVNVEKNLVSASCDPWQIRNLRVRID